MLDSDAALPMGAYELPVTRRVQERLAVTQKNQPWVRAAFEEVGTEQRERYASAMATVFADHFSAKLSRTKTSAERIALINSLAKLIDPDDSVDSERILHAVYESSLGEPPRLQPGSLNGSSLLTNATNDLSMAAEIKREIRTSDSVDLLCAFIRNSGISVIRDQLEYLRDRNIPLRVITSTYCGASDIQAIDRLVDEFGAQVKVGYESRETRLHAKAWLFKRNSGFDTAYIGSSNLSSSALIHGVEWNVRASRNATPEILDKFEAVFETYWNDNHYSEYIPQVDHDRLADALSREKRGGSQASPIELSGLEVEPWPYQLAMLEALESERTSHGRHRNLLIAATGTGKTVVAALDYRNLSELFHDKPPLLFVAHQRELLRQALRTYREVLRDPNFGELFDGTQKPRIGRHVFATIQTLHRHLRDVAPDHFDIVVIDEFHHAEASTYQKVIDHLSPKELLGLTATPERGDGVNVQRFFDYRVAYELRLWDALQLGLVGPMHYYGVNDETDLSDLKWSRSSRAYDSDSLSEFYIKQGDSRVKLVLNELRKRVFDLSGLKALGFCASIDHARFMADRFTHFGIGSEAVTSETAPADRARAIERLRSGELKVLFTVNLFNEGVDIPELNTLLLLRPTESPIIFLQQLGRGLRKLPGKVCTVLDFIGEQHESFDFERRYAALIGKSGKRLADEIVEEFPALPAGTHVQLDRVSQERVLRNVKRIVGRSVNQIRKLIQQESETDLARFLTKTGLSLEDIYRNKDVGGWTRLLRSQNLIKPSQCSEEDEDFLLRRLGSFLHVDDKRRAEAYVRLSQPHSGTYEELVGCDKIFARMLIVQIFGRQKAARAPKDWNAALDFVRRSPAFADELEQIFEYRIAQSNIIPAPISTAVDGGLYSHAHYSAAEMTAALKTGSLKKLLNITREGEHYVPEAKTSLIFVTQAKDERNFNSARQFKDYPVSTDLFHWISPATMKPDSKRGQRLVNHEQQEITVLLNVRSARNSESGFAEAYQLLGPVSLQSYRGEKPIQMDWKLQRPLPAETFTKLMMAS